MNKAELLNWLHEQNDRWEALLAEIGPDRMEQPGVNGDWSMKDLVGHLAGWQPRMTNRIRAAHRGEPEPPPLWPADLADEDDINAWIHESNKDRTADEVLADARRVIREMIAVIDDLPDNVRVETLHDRFHLVWIGDGRFDAIELFIHFRDDHEANVRAWLSRIEN